MLKLDNQLCFRLYSVSRKMTKVYQPLLKKYNITYPQYVVMLVVFENEVIDFKELSNKVNLKTGTMTPIVQKLEKLGYVKREKNKEDHRKINVSITKEGHELKDEIISVPEKLSNRLKLTEEMYETLVKELDKLDDVLDEAIKK